MKKILNRTNKSITIVLVIAILAVVNYLSYQLFYRFDLTQTKNFSISKASKNVAGGLDDVVNIKAYFSKNLPTQFLTLKQEVADILNEYQNYSRGKIRVEFIDPGTDEESQNKLMMAGIPPLQLNVMEKDKYQVVQGYMGMTISYGDKSEPIPVIQDTSDLEYQITAAIKKVSAKQIATIGYLTSNGCVASEGIQTAMEKLKGIYDVQEFDLKSEKSVPKSINTLIIAGPTEKFDDVELKAIDSYLSSGGSLLVFMDGVKVDQKLQAQKNDTGLQGLLAKYGIRANTDLVLDPRSGVATFNGGSMIFSLQYPYWPRIIKGSFDPNVAAVANLQDVVLPWVSSVDTIQNVMDKDNKISNLIETSENSFRVNDNFNLNPQATPSPGEGVGKYGLALLAQGKFQSAYEKNKVFNSRIAVVGDADFFKDNFVKNSNNDNLQLFQNLADALTMDESLINIRSKGVMSRPIKDLTEAQKSIYRYVNIFGVTLLVIAAGTYRYVSRRRKKSA